MAAFLKMKSSTATNQGIEMVGAPSSNHIIELSVQQSQPWEYNDVEMIDFNPHAACDKAFDTVEILEAILLHVDMWQLFPIQRVSKTVCNTINGSPRLLRKMALKVPRKTKLRARGDSEGICFNTIFRNTIFLPRLAVQEGFIDGIHAMVGHSRQLHEDLENGELSFYRYREMDFHLPDKNFYINVAYRDASWRKMLIAKSQLPPFRTSMYLKWRAVKEAGSTNSMGFGEERSGFVTMGEVVDAVGKEYNEYWSAKANGGSVRKTLREADDWLDNRTTTTWRGSHHRV